MGKRFFKRTMCHIIQKCSLEAYMRRKCFFSFRLAQLSL